MTDFDSLLRVLKEAGVDFIIVGGVAAVAHGSAHLTQDLDVVYSRSDVNIRRHGDCVVGRDPRVSPGHEELDPLLGQQRPERVTLNLVINGTGTVWIDDVVLSKEPLD